jgi:hypothetical protein
MHPAAFIKPTERKSPCATLHAASGVPSLCPLQRCSVPVTLLGQKTLAQPNRPSCPTLINII